MQKENDLVIKHVVTWPILVLHLRVLDDVQTKISEFVTQEEIGKVNLQKHTHEKESWGLQGYHPAPFFE